MLQNDFEDQFNADNRLNNGIWTTPILSLTLLFHGGMYKKAVIKDRIDTVPGIYLSLWGILVDCGL